MRLRRNKDEIECMRCKCLTESSNSHPVTKTGNYCYDCYLTLKTATSLPKPVDIRRDDHEPLFQHQTERDNPKPVEDGIDQAYRKAMYAPPDSDNDPWPSGKCISSRRRRFPC